MWEHYRNDNVPDICRGWWTPADGATRNYVINDTELAFEFAACSYAWMPAGMPGGAWGCSYSMTAETTGEDPCEHSSWLGGRYVICRGPLPEQLCNQEVVLRSNSGDYLSRERDGSIGVSAHAGYDEFWTVECAGARIVQLRSSGGDYLHRPDTSQGVTTWHTGNGNRWRLISNNGDRVMLRSWQGDYLHRSASAVTTWPTGPGNLWIMELR
jgi:hypothetical protein